MFPYRGRRGGVVERSPGDEGSRKNVGKGADAAYFLPLFLIPPVAVTQEQGAILEHCRRWCWDKAGCKVGSCWEGSVELLGR